MGQPGRQKEHAYLYWEFHEQGCKQAVRKDDWKAVRLDVSKNPEAPIELYDLSIDVGETNDVAAAYPEIVEVMRQIMTAAHAKSELFPLFPSEKH
jgi:arylsulfatase A-like enzyme